MSDGFLTVSGKWLVFNDYLLKMNEAKLRVSSC